MLVLAEREPATSTANWSRCPGISSTSTWGSQVADDERTAAKLSVAKRSATWRALAAGQLSVRKAAAKARRGR
jgi:hypothetical protein